MSGIFRLVGKLYGPGVLPLETATTSYTFFTGAHKAQVGSVQLVAFRPVLVFVDALESGMAQQGVFPAINMTARSWFCISKELHIARSP